MSVPPEEIAYQQAHAGDFNADGLSAFCITGVVVVFVAVLLRMWSRRLQQISLQADDYTLIVAMILSLTAVVLFDVRVYNWGLGRHFYAISENDRVTFEKIDYAFNLFYTTGYPLSRISLVLLYRRIFVQAWFHKICWFFVFVFSGYMISTIVIDSMLDIPVQAYWNPSITPDKTIDLVKLYIANAGFNIATDSILLVLPMTIIWRLNMTTWQKIGLTAIFCMGGLTLVASIARLVFFFSVDRTDISYSLIPIVWWTSAELFLGVLCPCLVTYRPLLRAAASFVSTHASRTDYTQTGGTGVERKSDKSYKMKTTTKSGSDDASLLEDPSHRRFDTDLERQNKEYEISPAIPMTQQQQQPRLPPPAATRNMPINHNAEDATSLARLDPRTSQRDSAGMPLGSTAGAEALPPSPLQDPETPDATAPTTTTTSAPTSNPVGNGPNTTSHSTHASRNSFTAFNFTEGISHPSADIDAMNPHPQTVRHPPPPASGKSEAAVRDTTTSEEGLRREGLAFGRNGKGVPKGMIGVKKEVRLENQ